MNPPPSKIEKAGHEKLRTVENLGDAAVVSLDSKVDILRHGIKLHTELSSRNRKTLLNLSSITRSLNGILQDPTRDLRQNGTIRYVDGVELAALEKHVISTHKNLPKCFSQYSDPDPTQTDSQLRNERTKLLTSLLVKLMPIAQDSTVEYPMLVTVTSAVNL